MEAEHRRALRYGMVGGGPPGWIGEAHRRAAALAGRLQVRLRNSHAFCNLNLTGVLCAVGCWCVLFACGGEQHLWCEPGPGVGSCLHVLPGDGQPGTAPPRRGHWCVRPMCVCGGSTTLLTLTLRGVEGALDFVVVVTPNPLHYDVSRTFLEACSRRLHHSLLLKLRGSKVLSPPPQPGWLSGPLRQAAH